MESDNITRLLDKYFEAETTLVEEQYLKAYFAKKDGIAPHLKQYASMFRYITATKKDTYTKPLPQGQKAKSYIWAAAAAVLAIAVFSITATMQTNKGLEDQYSQAEIAAAQEAFSLFTKTFNKGTTQLHHLDTFEENTNKFLINP